MCEEKKVHVEAKKICNIPINGRTSSGAASQIFYTSDGKSVIKVMNISEYKQIFMIYGINNVVEIDIMTRFKHPHLMYAEELFIGKSAEVPYAIKMPKIGRCLRSKKSNPDTFIDIFYKVASAVEFLHKNHILHLDIHSGNILITDDYKQVMLIDFGNSRYVHCVESGLTKFTGNYFPRQYRPPENLVKDTAYTQKSDVWALGICMLGYITDKYSEIEGDSINIIRDFSNPTPILEKWIQPVKLPEPIKPLIINLLAKMFSLNPHNRITMVQVLSHPVFNYADGKGRERIDGYVIPIAPLPPSSIQTPLPIIKNTICIVQKIHLHLRQYVDIEDILFLAVDLVYRTQSLEIKDNKRDDIVRSLACIIVAIMFYNHWALMQVGYTIEAALKNNGYDIIAIEVILYQGYIIEALQGNILRMNVNRSWASDQLRHIVRDIFPYPDLYTQGLPWIE